jgi:hypothetical protein
MSQKPADTLNDLIVPLVRQARYAEALDGFDQVLRLDPSHTFAWNNRGICLEATGRLEESLQSLDKAVALDAEFADAWANRAKTLARLGHVDDALIDCDRALTLNPEHGGALMNKAMLLLLQGRLEEGFQMYGNRWRVMRQKIRPRQGRLWMGGEPLAGKTLLIHPEQGMGDCLQFCRYALVAIEQGARVILEVPQPLVRLMQGLHADIVVVAQGDPVPAHDLHCPLLSLPRAFHTSLLDIPAAPYLRADARRAAAWRRRLGQGRGGRHALKVGLVWSGGHRPDQPEIWDVNERRNIPLMRLASLNLPGIRFISLQKGDEPEGQLHHLQAMGWSGPQIEDYSAELHDFADTAALVDCLDLVISVDTSTAHLAAGMGKPTWVLNRHDTCWRWMIGRDDSPWYPSLRLFRQAAPGDWTPVVARVRAELARLVAAGRSERLEKSTGSARGSAMVNMAHDLQTFPMNPGSGDGLPPGAAAAAGTEPNRQGLAARIL